MSFFLLLIYNLSTNPDNHYMLVKMGQVCCVCRPLQCSLAILSSICITSLTQIDRHPFQCFVGNTSVGILVPVALASCSHMQDQFLEIIF